MKIRSTFLALAVLLLFGALVSAAPISTAADTAGVKLAAIFSAPGSPDCEKSTLPSFEPAPVNKSGIACGSCSDSLCQGKTSGTFCKSQNGKIYTCQLAYVVCSARDCECWNGPLP